MTERGDEGVAPEVPPDALAESLAGMTDSLMAGEPVGLAEAGELPALGETVARLRTVLCVGPPSLEFATRLRERALAALAAPGVVISERLREVIARLVGEEAFRRDFLVAPETTLRRAGVQLSSVEMAALKRMEPDDLREWMADLDERISKSGLPW
jgi:hypothetical protein